MTGNDTGSGRDSHADAGEGTQGRDEPEPGDGDRESLAATTARVGAWVLGPALVALGAFGMGASPLAGAYLLLGLLVTPRTRHELREFCWIVGREP